MRKIGGMKYDYVEEQLKNYRARLRAEKNQRLELRLTRRRTTEDMLRILRSSAGLRVREDEISAS